MENKEECSCIDLTDDIEDYADTERCICVVPKHGRNAFGSVLTHECVECKKVIEKGEKYEDMNLYGGECGYFWVETCLDCVSIRDEFFCSGYVLGRLLEDLRKHVQETNGNISSECLGRLTPRARNVIVEMIDELE